MLVIYNEDQHSFKMYESWKYTLISNLTKGWYQVQFPLYIVITAFFHLRVNDIQCASMTLFLWDTVCSISMRRIWEQEKNVQTLKGGNLNNILRVKYIVVRMWNALMGPWICTLGSNWQHCFRRLWNFPGLFNWWSIVCERIHNICFAWCYIILSFLKFMVEKYAFKLPTSKSYIML